MLSAGKHWGKHAPEPALRPFVMHQGGEMEEEITLYERGYHGACCGCREVGHLIRDRLHRGGNGNPRQDSCLENPMDWESWEATVHGVAESRTRLSDFTSLYFTEEVWCWAFRDGLASKRKVGGIILAGRRLQHEAGTEGWASERQIPYFQFELPYIGF